MTEIDAMREKLAWKVILKALKEPKKMTVLVPCKNGQQVADRKARLGFYDLFDVRIVDVDDCKMCGYRCESIMIGPEWSEEEIQKVLLPYIVAPMDLKTYMKYPELRPPAKEKFVMVA